LNLTAGQLTGTKKGCIFELDLNLHAIFIARNRQYVMVTGCE